MSEILVETVPDLAANACLPSWQCAICFDKDVPVLNPCADQTHGAACQDCFRGYIGSLLNDSFFGSCPQLRCPLCLGTTSENGPKTTAMILPSAEVFNLFPTKTEQEKYNNLANNLLSFQCSGCHCRKSLQEPYARAEAWPQLCKKLDDAVKVNVLDTTLGELSYGILSLEECYNKIAVEYFPIIYCGKDEIVDELFKLILRCVYEPERRANLHLRYLRDRPFISTACCKKKHCFVCKTRNTHPGMTCAENCNSAFANTRVLPCPSCGIHLAKGDGCDHITWSATLKTMEKAEEFKNRFPVNTAYGCAQVLCERIEVENMKAAAAAWRAKNRLETNSSLVQILVEEFRHCTSQWCANFSETAKGKPAIYSEIKVMWKTMHEKEVLKCETQNEVALKSIYTTMFPSAEDRAGGLTADTNGSIFHLKNQVLSSKLCALISPCGSEKLKKSAQLWSRSQGRVMATPEVTVQQRATDQFLCIYGHAIPSMTSDNNNKTPVSSKVKSFEIFKSDQRLCFREMNTIVTRIGRISCYPAALAPLTSPKSITRFRILFGDSCGNCMSFGLCKLNFPSTGSSGIGPTKGTWGILEHKDAYASGKAAVYADGVKVDTWRSLVAGDSITIYCDLMSGTCKIRLNDGEFSYTFRSIPPLSHENYCFGTILASDNVIRIENVNGMDNLQREPWAHNNEHVDMFHKFRSLHMHTNRKENQHEQERAAARAEQWEQMLNERGYRADTVFPYVYPTLLTVLDIPCPEANHACLHSWNDRGDKLNWNFVDMALCWGRVNGVSEGRQTERKPLSVVSEMVELFKTEGSIPAAGCMPVLPVLER